MNITTIASKRELTQHESSIATLYQECFGERLLSELWHWAYLDNPNGEPVVTLCHDEGRLVAHYAVVPMPLKSPTGRINAYLSMTTMVSASHRMHGLFVKTAQACYVHGRALGIDFVMGFPNDMSAPGFRKRLDWTLPEPDKVVALDKTALLRLVESGEFAMDNRASVDLWNEDFRQWRLSKPGCRYVWRDGLVYKEYGDSIDLMAFDDPRQLQQLPDGRPIHMLVPAEYRADGAQVRFLYQFGGITVAAPFDPATIRREMAMSDVF